MAITNYICSMCNSVPMKACVYAASDNRGARVTAMPRDSWRAATATRPAATGAWRGPAGWGRRPPQVWAGRAEGSAAGGATGGRWGGAPGRTRGGVTPSPCAGRRSRSNAPRCTHCTSHSPSGRNSSSSATWMERTVRRTGRPAVRPMVTLAVRPTVRPDG